MDNVAVIGVPDDETGDRVVGVVRPLDGAIVPALAEELGAWLLPQLTA